MPNDCRKKCDQDLRCKGYYDFLIVAGWPPLPTVPNILNLIQEIYEKLALVAKKIKKLAHVSLDVINVSSFFISILIPYKINDVIYPHSLKYFI